MNIAIIRGPNLNPFEMQSYLPLAAEHNLIGFASPGASFRENGAGMKIHWLPSAAQWTDKLSPRLRRLAHHLTSRTLGPARTWLVGLERQLPGMDILHAAETTNGYSYQAWRAKRDGAGALVITAWENIPFNFGGHPFGRYVKKRVRTGADHFIAVTQQAKECLEAEGVEASRISVIPAGVDVSRFCPGPRDPELQARLGLQEDRLVILFVGRLVPEKGVWDLLRAVQHLHLDYGLQADLLMVGEGREKARLLEASRRRGLEEFVHVWPPRAYEEMPEVYRLADVFVLPSRPTRVWQEQFGMVLIEAMACGAPVVATASGAIPEVVGEAGLLVPADAPVRLAEAIAKTLRDRDLREHLRRTGLERARKHFCHLQVSRRIAQVYECVQRCSLSVQRGETARLRSTLNDKRSTMAPP